MRVGLVDVDGHNFPNLVLMKLSAWHKRQGDSVHLLRPDDVLLGGNLFGGYDKLYAACVFSESRENWSTHAEDLHRVYWLREHGYDPYVMIYDKPNAPRETRRLQRWVNNKIIFRSCERFEDYRG